MGELFIGIDVARDRVEVATRPAGEGWPIANDAAGIADLVVRLRDLGPALIVLEATGGLELPPLECPGSSGAGLLDWQPGRFIPLPAVGRD